MRSFFAIIPSYLYRLTILLLSLVSLIAFFLLTTPGLFLMVKTASLFLPGTWHINGLHGRAIDHISIAQLIYTDDATQIELKQFDLHWNLRALLQHKPSTHQATWQAINGSINHKPLVSLHQGILSIKGILPNLNITLKATLTSPIKGTVTIRATTSSQGGNALALLTTKQGNYTAKMDLKGQFHDLSSTNLSITSQINALYNTHPLTLNLDYHNHQFHALATLGPNQLTLIGQSLFPLTLQAKLVDMSLLSPQLTTLHTAIDIDAKLAHLQHGTLALTIHPGTIALSDKTTWSFQGGILKASLNSKQLQTQGNFIIDKDKTLTLSALLPHFQLAEFDSPKQVITGNLHLKVASLTFLEEVIPAIGQVSGYLQANLTASGHLGKPVIDSNLELIKASLTLPEQGISLNPIQLSLQSHDKTWTAKGSVASNGNPIIIQGEGIFSKTMQGVLNIHGDTVAIMNSSNYHIFLSPNIRLEFAPDALRLRGTILVPKADIKPQTFTHTVSLTDDAVFINKAIPPPNPYHLDTDIRIEMGSHVAIAIEGLKGLLTGGIQLRQLPQKSMIASGELNISDGKYQAYGQDLVIEQGQLLFSNEAIDNPELHVRAIRHFNHVNNSFDNSNQLYDFHSDNLKATNGGNKTRVGIEVSGRLHAPKVQLFSIPSTLTQADILSYLLLGKPANQANKSGGQLLLAAVSALNLDSGHGSTQLLTQLKDKLGLDFNLDTHSAYDQKTGQSSEKTAVVVSKALSKRLYLSYNMGLSQTDNNVLTLKYLLNAFFSIQVNGSMAGSGIDLLYTHQKD